MEMSLASAKQSLRKQMIECLKNQSEAVRTAASAALKQKLRRLDFFAKANTVMMYLATAVELSLDDSIRLAWELGKKVLVPRVESNFLRPYVIEDLENDVLLSSRKIREPKPTLKRMGLEEIDLVLVPGLAFNRSGKRLGRGQGFYDRFLAELPKTSYTIGVCFSCQLLDAVPFGANDQIVMEVISI